MAETVHLYTDTSDGTELRKTRIDAPDGGKKKELSFLGASMRSARVES